MNTHDSQAQLEALYRRGQTCEADLMPLLRKWYVAELCQRIPFELRSQHDRELIGNALEQTIAWIKAIETYRAIQTRRITKDIIERITVATLHEEYLDNGVNDARQAIEDALSLLPPMPTPTPEVFISMSMEPELDNICMTIKEACNHCGILAVRADDIQHSGLIMDVVLNLIASCRYLIADLTRERHNVYHEIGIAAGLKKEIILVCKRGTKLHFNLAGNNVLEYEDCDELKHLIIDRLQALPMAA
jgi:hypothetical protein